MAGLRSPGALHQWAGKKRAGNGGPANQGHALRPSGQARNLRPAPTCQGIHAPISDHLSMDCMRNLLLHIHICTALVLVVTHPFHAAGTYRFAGCDLCDLMFAEYLVLGPTLDANEKKDKKSTRKTERKEEKRREQGKQIGM
jgi:hypothetical protein